MVIWLGKFIKDKESISNGIKHGVVSNALGN